ncbi:hypothetical protein IMSAG049_01677 [Clostridiales bacterium]|nr:hypothetical protein IMSAG049_01677 [Clostridiales bacterium]
MPFLPITKEEMDKLGWEQPDFVYVCGDAYVDHPSFGAAIICRVLESHGYKVCMLSQPDWHNTNDFKRFGEPRLAFLVSAGNIDSMVNHYTVAKKRRSRDSYSPNGQIGLRPDRATIVYCNKIREAYKKTAIVIGGIEASLRRLSHYDYWDNKVRRSILLDSGADILLYGMGEHQIIELADSLNSGIPIGEITFLKGSVYKTRDRERIGPCVWLPSYAQTASNKRSYAESFMLQYQNTDFVTAQALAEEYREGIVVQNPPSAPLGEDELDSVYALPFMRTYHPIYEHKGGIPAINEIKFSLTANRGCFGNCNFCAIVFHQGRIVTSRSEASLLDEAKLMTSEKDFKGYIHDVGGPTANFMQPACKKQLKYGACKDRQCLFPEKCPNLIVDHKKYLLVLRKLRSIPKVKKVFIRSGIRFDYLIYDKDESFFNELCKYHISGQLRVAPEHISDRVLDKMGKPIRAVYESFVKRFDQINKKYGLNQYCIPYLMSSHPGSDMNAAIDLAEYLRDIGHMPEQVQDFYPTPGTLSTCMYYTEMDPRTGKKIYVPKNPHEKAMQRALMQYRVPSNYDLVKEALIMTGRTDLIGYSPRCLIKPKNEPKSRPSNEKNSQTVKKRKTIRNVHKKSR